MSLKGNVAFRHLLTNRITSRNQGEVFFLVGELAMPH